MRLIGGGKLNGYAVRIHGPYPMARRDLRDGYEYGWRAAERHAAGRPPEGTKPC